MKLKIALVYLVAVLMPSLSSAISIGSISDAISDKAPTAATTEKSPAGKTTTAGTTSALPNPALFIEDAAMTAWIHSQLLLKHDIPAVTVTTENAIVSLSGTVETQKQADTLVQVASSVKGVKAVKTDQLVIREKTAG